MGGRGVHTTRALRLGIVLLLGALSVPASGQPRERWLGIGGMVGKTAGATIKLYIRSTAGPSPGENLTSVGLDLSINDQEYLWTAHAVTHRTIPGSPLKIFLGPGAAFGSRKDELFFGPSSALGIFFDKHRFEVFMQVTPRIVVSPYFRGEFGSAVGLRYYL